MTKLNIVLIIIDALVILISLSIILYKSKSEKLNYNKDRLVDSEGDCLKAYKHKFELLTKLIEMTESKYKVESKSFDSAKEIDVTSLDSFKNEKLLNKCYKEILQIRDDNSKVREPKAFKELLDEYHKNEILLVSLRSYHNKYTLIFNNMIKKFPYNIICKLKRYNLTTLIDGNEIESNFNNNLEV